MCVRFFALSCASVCVRVSVCRCLRMCVSMCSYADQPHRAAYDTVAVVPLLAEGWNPAGMSYLLASRLRATETQGDRVMGRGAIGGNGRGRGCRRARTHTSHRHGTVYVSHHHADNSPFQPGPKPRARGDFIIQTDRVFLANGGGIGSVQENLMASLQNAAGSAVKFYTISGSHYVQYYGPAFNWTFCAGELTAITVMFQ